MLRRISIVICAFLLCSCNSNDDVDDTNQLYFLVSYTPNAMLPETQFYNAVDINWIFNFESQTIIVEVSEGITPVVLEEGSYFYDLVNHPCNFDDHKQLLINGIEYGVLISENDSQRLTLTDACIDGHILVFEQPLLL